MTSDRTGHQATAAMQAAEAVAVAGLEACLVGLATLAVGSTCEIPGPNWVAEYAGGE